MRKACRRHDWLAACLCDNAHTRSSGASTKVDGRNNHSLNSGHLNHHSASSHLPHHTLAGSTVGTHTTTTESPISHHHHNNNSHHQIDETHVATTTTPNNQTPHRAHPSTINNNNNPLASYPSSTSSSQFNTDALNAAFSLPAFMATDQNNGINSNNNNNINSCTSPNNTTHYHSSSITFNVQQMNNNAQLYATPPSTPSLSELYDTADPTLLTLPKYPKQSMSSSRLHTMKTSSSSKKYHQFPSSTSFSNIPHHHLTSSSSSYDSSDSHLYPRPPNYAPPPPPSDNNMYVQTMNNGTTSNLTTLSPTISRYNYHNSTSSISPSNAIKAVLSSLDHNGKHQMRSQRSALQLHNYHNLPDSQHNNHYHEDESNYLQPKQHQNKTNAMCNGSFSSLRPSTMSFMKPPASPRNRMPPRKPERPQKMTYKSHENIRT